MTLAFEHRKIRSDWNQMEPENVVAKEVYRLSGNRLMNKLRSWADQASRYLKEKDRAEKLNDT